MPVTTSTAAVPRAWSPALDAPEGAARFADRVTPEGIALPIEAVILAPVWLVVTAQVLPLEVTLVGAPPEALNVKAFNLIGGRHSLSGSVIGGIRETQEMLDFCGEHNITADVEVIPIQKINEAYERLLKSDVKYRFSIDMASIKSE